MNISIKKFLQILGVIFLAFGLILIYFAHEIRTKSNLLAKTQEQKYQTRLIADMLRQSSDDLTRFARMYVVTADKKFKENFNNVLYIRNGEIPLPKNYHNIYWDLLEPTRTDLHPKTKKISLTNMMKKLSYDNYEQEQLKIAKQSSDELVNSLEIEAFNAMIGLYKDTKGNYTVYSEPDQTKAIELLHSDNYLKAKERVMISIDNFLEHLDKRTNNEIIHYKKTIKSLGTILLIISISFIFIFFISIALIRKKIIIPLKTITKLIKAFRLKMPITQKLFYTDEIGYLTKEFFKMKNEIEEDIRIIGDNKRNMEQYLKLVDQNILTSSTDLHGNITYASEAFSQISGYSKKHLLGKNHRIVKHPDMSADVYKELWETISQDKKWQGELKNRSKDGSAYWVDATIYPNYDQDGKKTGYTAIRVDISAKKQVEKLLKESNSKEKKIQQYIELVDKNIITSSTDINGKITYVSEAFANISGFTKNELLGNTHRIVKHEENDPSIYENMWETISNNRVWNGIIKNKKKDGSFYWVDATIYPIFNEYGEKAGYTAIRIDITDKKRVESLMVTDDLTKIYNRRYFNEMFPKAMNIAKRDRKYFSFIILDIDHFKQYNDTYGHQEGDKVLIQVASAIKSCLQRASDLCYRLGGEEFGVTFESLNPQEAFEFAEQIRVSIENLKIEHNANSASDYVTASFGLTTKKTTKDIDPDTLYKLADDLLYKAKELGRNRVAKDS